MTADPLLVVVFGPAGSGKSALAAMLAPHLAGRAVRLADADGATAGKVLAGDPAPADVLAADALLLVVDAADRPEQIDATFGRFSNFLDRLEERRAFGREAGGLPVVLTLAKCDALAAPGDEPSDWLRRVEDRKAEVRQRFEDWFADALTPTADGYRAFGSVELDVAATARVLPPGPAFAGYADPGGTFGVSDLARLVVPAANDHRERQWATAGRLRRTAMGVGGLVLTLLAWLATFALAPAGDPLTERVRDYQRREGPPAVRLGDRVLPAARKELTTIRAAAGFDRLPTELQSFVENRLREADEYADYRKRFQPPRLGPAEVRSRPQMDALRTDLAGELAAPPAWADTDAGKLAAKWATDLRLLESGERELHDWHRDRIRRGDLLLLTESPPDPGWRAAVTRLLAEVPPHPAAEPVAGSPTAPGPRGKPLTWAAADAGDRVSAARRDWADTAGRLTALREVCDAVGLTAAGVLQFAEPLPPAASLLPNLPVDDRWSVGRFPDPVRGVVAGRLTGAWATAIRGLRSTAEARLTDPDVTAWGELLRRLSGWAGGPASDPVKELADFLRRDWFEIDLRTAVVTLPDDLLDPPPTPAGPLTVTRTPAGGSPVRLTLEPSGDPVRDRPNSRYRFAGPVLAVRPGDTLSATLPVRSGGDVRELVWPAGDGRFPFLQLGRPPRLSGVEAVGVALTAPGLTAPVLLADPAGR